MKNVYIIGIEGAGTSALALLYKKRGYIVSGSDDGDGFYRSALEEAGIEVHETFDTGHITSDIDFVVHSTAFGESNPEVAYCKEEGIVLLAYPEAIGELTKEFYTIAVCGTHGKTTTTGFTAESFVGAGRDVNAIVGAPVTNWKEGGVSVGARYGKGDELILEADEYQNKLAYYHPQSVILTSMDYDHPDFFATPSDYRQVFIDFIQKIPRAGFLVAYHDDWDIIKAVNEVSCRVVTYGRHTDADVVLLDREVSEAGQDVSFRYDGAQYGIHTKLPGEHNALNALAAWTMTVLTTKDQVGAEKGIANYAGVARRFEQKGEYAGARLIDDYAHHPEEIRTTLATTKELYKNDGKNIIAAFHPHTYTRTKALLDDFARALDLADQVIVIDIYGSAREEQGGVHAKDLVDAINQGINEKAKYVPDIESLATWAEENLTLKDVFITLGAGDIYKVHDKLKTKNT